MRVTFLTHYYPPEVGAPQARIEALADGLHDRGVQVAVHTGFPNYPDGRVRPPYRVRPLRRERRADVAVVRSAVYPAPNAGIACRLANHLSFAGSALASAPLAPAADVVVVETPPLFLAGAGIAYARLKRARLVTNVADRWPTSAVELGMLRGRLPIRAAERLERAVYRASTAITAPSAGLAAALEREPSAGGKVVQMPPAVDLDRFLPSPPPRGDRLEVLYAGTIGLAQGVATLVRAAKLTGADRVRVTIAGGGADADELQRLIRRERVENVRLIGIVPHHAVPGLYARADLAAVLLRDRPLFEAALPTKTLEAMAAGRGVILSGRGEAASVLEAAGAGIAVPPEQPAALADALVRLQGDPPLVRRLGEAGRAAAEASYSRERSVERWLELLERVTAARTDRPRAS